MIEHDEILALRRALFEAIGLLEFTAPLGKKSPVVIRGRELLAGWSPRDAPIDIPHSKPA